MKVPSAIRTRVGMAVVGGVLLTATGTATAAVVVSSPDTSEVSDVAPVTPSQTLATTTEAPDPVAPPAVAAVTTEAPAVSAPPTTVEPVTEPAPQAPAETEPDGETPYDPTAPWTDSAGLTYVPATPVPMDPIPGEGQLPNG